VRRLEAATSPLRGMRSGKACGRGRRQDTMCGRAVHNIPSGARDTSVWRLGSGAHFLSPRDASNFSRWLRPSSAASSPAAPSSPPLASLMVCWPERLPKRKRAASYLLSHRLDYNNRDIRSGTTTRIVPDDGCWERKRGARRRRLSGLIGWVGWGTIKVFLLDFRVYLSLEKIKKYYKLGSVRSNHPQDHQNGLLLFPSRADRLGYRK
jgi:hypothetical protein